MGSNNPLVQTLNPALAATGKGASQQQEPASSQAMAQIAQQLFQQTDPLRQMLIGQSTNFLGGNYDLTQNPQYAALKQAAEQQFGVARNQALADVPTGGALTNALSNIDIARAGALTSGLGNIAQQQQQQALGLATGTTGQTLQGLGQSGALQAQIANLNAQQNASTKQGLGLVAGSALAAK